MPHEHASQEHSPSPPPLALTLPFSPRILYVLVDLVEVTADVRTLNVWQLQSEGGKGGEGGERPMFWGGDPSWSGWNSVGVQCCAVPCVVPMVQKE